jgi:NADP-dependent 3-hydroxy acid dehydrogenase YdfG
MGCFERQVAVVTGASSGIGRAMAITFATEGAEVCLVARRREVLESVAEEICANGGHAHICCTDLTRDEEIHRLVEGLKLNFGYVHVLTLCGGVMIHGTTEQAPVDQFDLHYRSNLRSHYLLIQSLLPLLRKQSGQIVFMNSSVATRASSGGIGQYAAIQNALRAIADTLRDEVNADGIRVLSIYPGRTATPRIASLCEKEGRPYHPELLMQPQDVATMVSHALSLPRTAEVTEIRMRPMMKS